MSEPRPLSEAERELITDLRAELHQLRELRALTAERLDALDQLIAEFPQRLRDLVGDSVVTQVEPTPPDTAPASGS